MKKILDKKTKDVIDSFMHDKITATSYRHGGIGFPTPDLVINYLERCYPELLHDEKSPKHFNYDRRLIIYNYVIFVINTYYSSTIKEKIAKQCLKLGNKFNDEILEIATEESKNKLLNDYIDNIITTVAFVKLNIDDEEKKKFELVHKQTVIDCEDAALKVVQLEGEINYLQNKISRKDKDLNELQKQVNNLLEENEKFDVNKFSNKSNFKQNAGKIYNIICNNNNEVGHSKNR